MNKKSSNDLRKKAEQLLNDNSTLINADNIQDVKALIHELHVHQIELVIQNEELQSAQQALEKSRDTYVKLFDFAPIGYFTFDQEGLVREANLTGAKMIGIQRNFLLRKPFMTYIIHEDQHRFYNHRKAVFDEMLPQNVELTLINRRGEHINVKMQSILLQNKDEETGRDLCLSAVMDISERIRAENELMLLKDTAENANKAKSEFLARMSHEIRTPLHGILGMTDITIESGLKDEQVSYLTMVKQSALNLLNIVNDILDISKVESGKLDLNESEFNLSETMTTCLSPLEHTARDKGLNFSVHIDSDVPRHLHGDQARLKQVILNLVGNAVKFTKNGHIEISVSLAEPYEKHDSRTLLQFVVEDSGIGIAAEKLPYIFDRFYQADGSMTREFEGSGLGLAISQHLVQLMGGDLSVESHLGEGSTFSFAVPFQIAGLGASDAAVSGRAMKISKKLKILLAEDNIVNQTFAYLLLTREGHEVITAGNGEEAIQALEEDQFDLVLMDIRMPGMDGLEAAERIRNSDSKAIDPNVPIIAMTAHSLKGDREKFLEGGMDDYISKPVSWEEMSAVINRVINKTSKEQSG